MPAHEEKHGPVTADHLWHVVQIGKFAKDIQNHHADRMGFVHVVVIDHGSKSELAWADDRFLVVAAVEKRSTVVEEIEQDRVERAGRRRVEW